MRKSEFKGVHVHVCARTHVCVFTAPQSGQTHTRRFTIREEDKSLGVTPRLTMAKVFDCENVGVSTKLGNKEHQ